MYSKAILSGQPAATSAIDTAQDKKSLLESDTQCQSTVTHSGVSSESSVHVKFMHIINYINLITHEVNMNL